MNILFLCHRIPFPPNKGDKIRSFNEIKYLSKRHSIFLGTILEEESDKTNLEALEKYCTEIHAVRFNRKWKLLKCLFSGKSFSVSNFYDKKLQRYIDRTFKEKKIDAVICYCSSMAKYIFESPLYKEKRLGDTKLIMDFVDLDSDKWLQYSRYSRFPLSLVYRIENRRLFNYEIEINQQFDHSVFVSQREVKVFKALYPEARNVTVIPNGVDYEYFHPKEKAIDEEQEKSSWQPKLVFTGVMDYFANEDGVRWFCGKIFPRIKAEFPRVQFYIVGNKPTGVVKNLSKIEGVTVTDYVDDIKRYYWMADVCVIPLRIARGLQNKVLEAMATGNAVVASSNASDGIICHRNIDIVIADDEEAFAREVISLLKDENRRKEMAKRAVDNIRSYYSWESNLQAFEEILDKKKAHS